MSEASKTARKALKSKAHRLAEPHKGAVDASGWTEPTDEGAGAQTGMRPISKRQYKRGGKVKVKFKHHLGHAEGEKAEVRADRRPRKAGGKLNIRAHRDDGGAVDDINYGRMERDSQTGKLKPVRPQTSGTLRTSSGAPVKENDGPYGLVERRKKGGRVLQHGKAEMPPVDRFINADKKKANEYRDGPKHVGGMKAGGRTKKMDGGPMMAAGGVDPRVAALLRAKMMAGRGAPAAAPAVDPRIAALMRAKMAAAQGAPSGVDPRVVALLKARAAGAGAPPMKKGGRTKKFGGGAMGGGMAGGGAMSAPMNASQSAGMGNQMFGQGMAAAQGRMGQQGYAQQAQPMAQHAQPMAQHAQFGPQEMRNNAATHQYQEAIKAYRAAHPHSQHPNVSSSQQAPQQAPAPMQQAPAAYSPPAMQAAPVQQAPQAQQQQQTLQQMYGLAGAQAAMGGQGNQMFGQGSMAAQQQAALGQQGYGQAAQQQPATPGYANAPGAAQQQSMPFTQASWGNNNLGSMAGQFQGGLGQQVYNQGAAAAGQGYAQAAQPQQPQAQQPAATPGYAAQSYNQAGMGQQVYNQGAQTAAGMLGVGNQNYAQNMGAAQGQGGMGGASQTQALQQQSMPYAQASWAGNNLASMAGGMGGGKPGGFKRGGRTMHDDEAADRALVKRMVKPEARTGKAAGGETEIHHSSCRCHRCMGGRMGKKHGGALSVSDGAEEGTRPTGGRMARKNGGLVKIIINDRGGNSPQGDGGPPGMAPRPPYQQNMPPQPQGGPGGPPPGQQQGPPPGPPPPPPPPPGPPPGPGPQQGPPVGPDGRPLPPPGPYKRGGRANYPNMEYGGGGGKGRLEKIKEYGP